MQRWEDKGITERITRTYVLPREMRAAGVTILTCAVTQEVHDGSAVPDPSPDILNGSYALNLAPITWRGEIIAANQAVLQPLKGGVINCDYVVKFTLGLSTGEPAFVEDCLQPVKKYAPGP